MHKRLICVIISVALLLLCSCNKKQEELSTQPDSNGTVDYLCYFGSGIYLTQVFSYTGSFYEDGSNDLVSDVMACVIENRSDNNFQIFDFSIKVNNEVYQFKTTSLFAKSSMSVIEVNRKAYVQAVSFKDFNVDRIGQYMYDLSLFTDIFTIETGLGELLVYNKSENELHNVYVYYKNINTDGVYLGGITYRAHFENLKPGSRRQLLNENFSPDYCKVVYVTYDEML